MRNWKRATRSLLRARLFENKVNRFAKWQPRTRKERG